MLKLKHHPITLAALATLGLAAAAHAQQAQPQVLERVEITGSNIKRVDAEGLQPVVTIKRADIERSGKSTVNDLLAALPAVNGGSFSEASGSGNTFAPGTASVSLRGLGVNTTLVLLNGRRIANYGFAQNLNEGFVDLNSIPVNAIERIDVLKDGASAVYGSDAIAGVINIILRKDYKGMEGSVSRGFTQDGGGGETRASVTGGFGDLAADRFNVSVTLDYYKRELISSQDRRYAADADNREEGPGGRDVRSPTGNPGYFFGGARNVNTAFSTCPADRVVPAASLGVGGGGTVCAFDFAYANKLLPDTERKGALARGNFMLTKDVELFGELLYTRNETGGYSAPTPAAFALAANHPDRPAGSTFTSVAYRFLEAGDRLSTLTSTSTRAVAGVRGTLANTDFELAALSGRNEAVSLGKNFIVQERATEAFAGTLKGFEGQFYRVLDPKLNTSILEAIKIDPRRVGNSKVDALDFKLSRELFDLAGGPAAIAAGLEYRKESVTDTPDWRVALANPNRVTVAGSGGTSVEGGRNLKSGYVEFSLPFFKRFESQIAIRTDRYSDFGTATTPKIGMSYRPNSKVLLRGGYAEGFRAPSLVEMFLGESTSFPSVRDTPRCTDYRNGPLGPNHPETKAACGDTATAQGSGVAAQVRTTFLGSKALEPEKSKSFSLGFVVEPARNLSIALDAYHIEHKQRILSPTAAFLLANEALFPGAVVRNAPSATDIAANARGSLRGVSGDLTPGIVRTFFNASKQVTHGVDVDFRYRFALKEWGTLDASTAFSYVGSLKRQQNPGQGMVELIDTYGYPRWRNVTSLNWNMGSWRTTANVSTMPSYEDANSVNGAMPRVSGFATLDAQVAYSGFKNMVVSVGGTNILNQEPPFSNNDWQGFDTSTHSPVGATWYARLNYKF